MMTARMPTTVFTVRVSMSDWTCCPDEYGPFFPNVDLKAALEVMHISLNLCDLCEYYFDEIAVGTGDILVFTSSRFTETYFIADLVSLKTASFPPRPKGRGFPEAI
jgi:hypothetical protein